MPNDIRRKQLILDGLRQVNMAICSMMGKIPYNVDIDDLVMEGMLAVMGAVDTWNDHGPAQFSTYAYTRVRGAMIDYVRKQWGRRAVISINDDSIPDQPDCGCHERKVITNAILQSLSSNTLSPEETIILELHYVRGVSQGEISRRLNMAHSSITHRVHVALDKLRRENKINGSSR